MLIKEVHLGCLVTGRTTALTDSLVHILEKELPVITHKDKIKKPVHCRINV